MCTEELGLCGLAPWWRNLKPPHHPLPTQCYLYTTEGEGRLLHTAEPKRQLSAAEQGGQFSSSQLEQSLQESGLQVENIQGRELR